SISNTPGTSYSAATHFGGVTSALTPFKVASTTIKRAVLLDGKGDTVSAI
ncbi:hypothetical protein Tco_0169693, partial [Tanacetum coccineum]